MNQPLFAELTTADRDALFAKAQQMSCHAGDVILREGEAGTKLFVIDAGVVAITRQHGQAVELLNVLTTGEYFGEMALLTIEARSATARAVELCELTVLAHTDFQAFVKTRPEVGAVIYRNFAMTLSERVRQLTEKFERLHPQGPITVAPRAEATHQGRMLTPVILIKGIAEILQEADLPSEKRTYFETVLRTQVAELADWLKTHD